MSKGLSDTAILKIIRKGQRDRYQRWRAKQKAKGSKNITVMLTPDTAAHLESLRQQTDLSIAKLVNQGLLALPVKRRQAIKKTIVE